jgi:MFS family permease
MQPETGVAAVAHAIQLSVTPVFLLLGIGTMLAVMTNRLARVVDRARTLQRLASESDTGAAEAAVQESSALVRRGKLISVSIALLTTAALLISTIIAILFAGTLLQWDASRIVALLFIAAMLAIVAGLVLFLREVFLATAGLRLRLDHGRGGGRGGR